MSASAAAMGDMFEQGISRLVTADFLAECFGVGRSMIYKYGKQGMPKEARGRYDLAKCIKWYCDRARSEGVEGEASRANADVRRELLEAQRDKTNLETEKLRGRLLEADEVAQTLNEVASIVATRLDALAPRLAAVVAEIDDPAQVQAEILTEARAVRAEIAGAVKDYARTP